jgi:hypothetical protein
MDSTPMQEYKKRLIVILPDGIEDHLNLAYKIRWMAQHDRCDVVYLTLVEDEDQRLTAARSMATMKAVTEGTWLAVSTRASATNSWLTTLCELARPGDSLVCLENHTIPTGFLKSAPISELLRGMFKNPIFSLAGFFHPAQRRVRRWARSLLFWVGFFIILGVFTLLEIQLDHGVQGAAHALMLIIILLFEVGAIWTWGSING